MNPQIDQIEASLPPNPGLPSKPRGWLPVRTLAAHHRDRVLAHLIALPERDRHLRFGHAATDEQIGHYVEKIDFDRDEIFGVFDDRLVLVAMAHLAYENDKVGNDNSLAEFGVSVLPHMRGRGIGGRLFEHAVVHARNRGAHNMAIHIARENSAMLGIVRKAGAKISFDGSEATAELGLPEDTLGSHMGALFERQAADLNYRIKMQVLRLDKLWPGRCKPHAPQD